ncbi:MAG: glycosyltransferase [Candidatus Omnitrophota bacterium]
MGQFKESERVSVIIPTYNGKHLLKECLSSLYELDYPAKQFEIKLVDNNSTDGTAQYVRRHFRKVEVLRNPENNYCKANNLGIAHSRAPFLAFLNNDTAVDRYWLRALVDSMYQDKRIGCVGSKVIFPDGRIQSAGHYEFPNFRWGDRGLREPDIGQYALSEEVGSLSGSSVLFRRFCLDDVGNFDEDFIMYLEDVDIFLRCRQKAWKLLYVPTSVVRHAFHGTAEEKHVHFYIERNRLLLIAKHFPRELSRALETKEHSLTYEELYRILPDIFLKLFFLHKDDVLKPVLSEFCLSLQRVYNFSKDQAVQELNKMLRNARQDVETVERDNVIFGDRAAKLESGMRAAVAQAEEFSKEVKKVTGESAAEKSALADRIAQIETALAEKKSAFAETQASFLAMQARAEGMQVEIAHRDAAAQDLLLQRDELQQQIENILHSRTYRYLAIPLWGIADAFKHFLIAKNKKNILVIKPYYVSTEQAEESLKAMQSLYKDAKITLFAHVFFPDYQRLKLNNLVDEKILFCPGTHALTFLRLIKTVFCLNSRYFDQTILLSGMPIYQGYRKAKILAFIIGGKRISVYDTLERKFKPLLRRNSFSKLNNELTLLWGAVSFWFVVLFFLLFIVLPLKLKSLFRK